MIDRIAIVETSSGGSIRYYDATAEFFEPKSDRLVLVSTVRDEDVCHFEKHEWVRVTVLDGNAKVLFSIQRGADPIKAVWLPDALQRVH